MIQCLHKSYLKWFLNLIDALLSFALCLPFIFKQTFWYSSKTFLLLNIVNKFCKSVIFCLTFCQNIWCRHNGTYFHLLLTINSCNFQISYLIHEQDKSNHFHNKIHWSNIIFLFNLAVIYSRNRKLNTFIIKINIFIWN